MLSYSYVKTTGETNEIVETTRYNIWADWYKATVYSLPNIDGDMQIILDDGLWTETIYDCSIHDITLDNDGEWELTTEFEIGRASCRERVSSPV